MIMTPGLDFQIGRVLSVLMAGYPEHFTGVQFAGDLPPGIPLEVPRIVLLSADLRFRLSAGPARVEITWERREDNDRPDIPDHLTWCSGVFANYLDAFKGSVGKIGCVVRRFAPNPDPALTLARHFCDERWFRSGQALERPDDFVVECANKYVLCDSFIVDSWFKCRSGVLAKTALG